MTDVEENVCVLAESDASGLPECASAKGAGLPAVDVTPSAVPDSVDDGVERCARALCELQAYLFDQYDFRYNVLTDCAEFRVKGSGGGFVSLDRRRLNTLVLRVQAAGFSGCWNEDVSRIACSSLVADYHPFHAYMSELPVWDGEDRAVELVARLSTDAFCQMALRRWLRAMAAQWMGREMLCANSLVPVLISRRQGLRKSTFCRMLMPSVLRAYYLDKLDVAGRSDCERKLAQFGLINLDEMDRYSERSMATLKNLVQLRELKFRKAYSSQLNGLPRVASFVATSNRTDLLSDPTGSRRFLCLEVERTIDCRPVEHDQLFAQLRAEVEAGELCWLTEAEEAVLQERNRRFYHLRPEEEAFRSEFRGVTDGEDDAGELLRSTEIFALLRQRHPALMRGVTAASMGRMLVAAGLERCHQSDGNYYRVVRLRPE